MVLEIHTESQDQDFISFMCLQKVITVWKAFPTLKKSLFLLLENCQNLKVHLSREAPTWAEQEQTYSEDLLDVNSSL